MARRSVPTPHPPRAGGGRREVRSTGGTGSPELDYWIVVEAVLRRLARRVAGQDADDVIQRVAEQFFRDPALYMGDYTPERFASVSLRTRADDHRRSERIQRGEGARLRTDVATGLRQPARTVCALDALDPEADHFGHDEATEWRTVTTAELRDALRLVEPRVAQLLHLVAIEGYSVTEAATAVDLSRAYANRRLAAAKRLLAEVITAA